MRDEWEWSHFVEFCDNAHSHGLVKRATDKEAKLRRGGRKGRGGGQRRGRGGEEWGKGRMNTTPTACKYHYAASPFNSVVLRPFHRRR